MFYFEVEKRTYHTVICDFGVSSFTATAITRNTANAGTMMYQHKESILGKRAEPYMDVYAMGCILLELYTS
jgi:serine/threonine protein kinase